MKNRLLPSQLPRAYLWLAMLLCFGAEASARPVLFEATTNTVKSKAGKLQTVLTFRFSKQPRYRIRVLPTPDRLVIDLPPADWLTSPAHLDHIATQIKEVQSVRYGWFQPGTYRIVLDLAGPVSIRTTDVQQQGQDYALAITWQAAPRYREQRFGNYIDPPIPRSRPAVAKARDKPVIVIDAGHGGVDPGAIGSRGTREKAITLNATNRLATKLRRTGRYEVVLTRSDDRFVRLRERVAIARRAKADLFLSIHADSAGSSAARGLSVYSLSDKASDKTAAALAQRENKADVIAGLDLSDEQAAVVSILIDLAQRESKNRSIRFANQLVQSVATEVRLLSRTHRQAGFAVLKAPDVPSVLVELGFLSNRDEETLLRSPQHLDLVAERIVAAIDNFFASRFADTGG
jgi:N-acetylmuramoyl-L-alanine amidase